MKKASLVIQDIQNNVYNDMLLDVYMDCLLYTSELMARQRMFKEEEHQMDEQANRMCNLMGGVK